MAGPAPFLNNESVLQSYHCLAITGLAFIMPFRASRLTSVSVGSESKKEKIGLLDSLLPHGHEHRGTEQTCWVGSRGHSNGPKLICFYTDYNPRSLRWGQCWWRQPVHQVGDQCCWNTQEGAPRVSTLWAQGPSGLVHPQIPSMRNGAWHTVCSEYAHWMNEYL